MYLSDRLATLETRVMLDVSPEELESLLERGWRRFGPTYFRPRCASCAECVTLRIPVASFSPTDSQKRARRRFRRFRQVYGPPRVDRERLEVYEAWHRLREDVRGWEPSPISGRGYQLQFAFPHPAANELAYYDDQAPGGPRLAALGLVDQTHRSLSAVYFFYAPEYARLSPGVANIVNLVELAKTLQLAYVYLGYRVLPCRSMQYKSRYLPHELLSGRPDFSERPAWQPQREQVALPAVPPPDPAEG